MAVEINDTKKQVVVWLRQDEDKAIAQPIIDKYKGIGYLVALFRSGKKDLYENSLSLLLNNRK